MKMLKVVCLLFFTLIFNHVHGQDTKAILFFGDSITAGYGIDTQDAFPALIQNRIDSLGYDYRVVNAGLSGETSAGGVRRVDWILRQQIHIFILELGGNDGLRGIDPDDTRQNLQMIMDRVWEKYPDVTIILTGMEAPPNMGQDYTESFRNIYTELTENNDVIFMPFILEGVAGNPELNLTDGIHPTVEGHKILSENIWTLLESVL